MRLMRLTLDTGQMRDCLELWRYSLATRVTRDATEPANAERGRALEKIDASIDGWLDLLRLCTPDAETDRLELQQITEQVRAFKDWAEQARMALKILTTPTR